MSYSTMHRTRRLLIAAAVIAVLAAFAARALRQALGGDRVRAAVEARLSATLGQPVSVGRLGIALFPRVALVGGTVRLGQARVQAPGLDIARVRVLPRLRSLWTGDVVIEEVELDGFLVSVLRDRAGGWHVPYAVPAASGAGYGAAIQRVRVTNGRVRVFDQAHGSGITETGSIDDLAADVTVEGGGLRLAPIVGRIGRAKISGEARTDAAAVRLTFAADSIADGDLPVFLRLLGSDRPAFLRLVEAASVSVSIEVDRASSRMTGKGVLRAQQVLLEPLRLQRLEAPFAIKGTTLEFDPTSFAMYGGTHRGAVTVDLANAPPSWTTDSRVNNLAVGEFLRALTSRDQRVDGVASINGTLRGRVGEPLDRTVNGRIHVVVTNGVVRNFPLLTTINRALQLAEQEDGDTRFERLTATLMVAAGQATTDDLVLEAGDVRVDAAGRIGADRSLALRGHAVVSAERVARAVASVPEVARLRNSRGEIDVPLTISGTLDAPSIAMDVTAAIRQGVVDELRRRLRRLIR